MRKTIIAALMAFVAGGALGGTLLAQAQPAPPRVETAPDRPNAYMHSMRAFWRGQPPQPTFALVYRQQDRQLSANDVQKIAEAFLLWRGNHTWKVVDVATIPDGPIGFALATQEGSVIARFTMDPHSGRVTRTA